MSDAAPLPCPFCGGSVEVSNRSPTDRALQIYCGECEFAIGGWTYEEGVIEAWNRRTPSAETELRAEVENLKAQNAMMRAVLESHHHWHQDVGVVLFPNTGHIGSDDPVECDLSVEYADSTLCNRTIAALGGGAVG